MYNKVITAACILITSALLSGCFLSTSTLKSQTSFKQQPTPATKAPSHQPIVVSKITDSREFKSPKTLVRKKNSLGALSAGTYQLDQPVAQVFSKMLKSSLDKQHYNINHHSDLVLTGSIIDTKLKMGKTLISSAEFAQFQVEMKLINKKTGDQLWSQIITGTGFPEDGENASYFSLTGNSEVANAFAQAMIKTIINLEKSPSFRDAVKRFKG